jgi:protein-disulfide isomerase
MHEPSSGPFFPTPVLYGVLAISILTNIILIGRASSIDWQRFGHRDQPVPAVTPGEHIRGNVDAPVTIIEYSDFQCPFCALFHEVLKRAVANGSQVRWVYRHLPLSEIHPMAVPAAEAAECASDQGQFWEYAELLFQRQKLLDDLQLAAIARDLNLDEQRFTACRQSGSHRERVAFDAKAFAEGHLTGTPTSFVNGTRLEGAVSPEEVQRAIDATAH